MLNQKLYEALPLVYIGSGILNALLLDSPVKYLPSALFVSAGLLVASWRWTARSKAQALTKRGALRPHREQSRTHRPVQR